MPLQHANQHSYFFEEKEECSCQSEAVIVPTVMKEEYLKNWRQYILVFNGGACAEKTQFIGQNFPKSPQKRMFLIFQKIACGAENLTKTGYF